MIRGNELFIGAKREEKFGHLIFAGLGGVFIEVLKDVSSALTPVGKREALDMINSLKGRKIFEGVRNMKGIDKYKFAEIIQRVSALVSDAPEIFEMDINPLIAEGTEIFTVDARIRIEK